MRVTRRRLILDRVSVAIFGQEVENYRGLNPFPSITYVFPVSLSLSRSLCVLLESSVPRLVLGDRVNRARGDAASNTRIAICFSESGLG